MIFGADAYRNEMGITNDLFPQERAFAITPEQMRLCDPFSDPEDIRDPRSRRRGDRQLRELYAFPGAGRAWGDQRSGSDRRAGLRGHRLHQLPYSGSRDRTERQSAVPSETAALFSDLLLHDVGTGDGIKQGEPTERNPNACALGPSAQTSAPARWNRHAGRGHPQASREAELARRGFERLSDVDRAALFAFLGSL